MYTQWHYIYIIYITIMIQYHSMIRSECSIPHCIDINYRSRICRKQFLCRDLIDLRISNRFQKYKISHRVQPQHRATWHRISADSASRVGGNREESWNQALCGNVLCYVVLMQLGLLQWLLPHASMSISKKTKKRWCIIVNCSACWPACQRRT